jgi:ABC-type glycerol-3-phosphate transport system substrate-binding protein
VRAISHCLSTKHEETDMTKSPKSMNRRSMLKASGGIAAAAATIHLPHRYTGAQDQTVTMWNVEASNTEQEEDLANYIQAVTEASGITLEVRGIPFAQFDNQSQAALAAGEGPDLLWVNSVTVGAFAERGYLLPTGDYLAASTLVSQDDFFEGLFGHVMYKDVNYGLPVDTGTRALFYNVAMLEEKGVEVPQTIEDLTAALPELSDPDNGVYGITYAGGERWVWLYEALGMISVPNGHAYVADDLSAGTVAEQVLPDLQWWVDVHNNGWASPEDVGVTDGSLRTTQFAQGRAATSFLGHWHRQNLIDNEAPEFGVVNLQGSENIGSTTGGWTLMITKDAADPDLAWQVMEHTFSNPDVVASLTTLMPATIAANELVLTEEFYEPFKEVLQTNARHPILLNAALPEMAEIARTESQAAILGAKSAEQASADMDSQFMQAIQNFE